MNEEQKADLDHLWSFACKLPTECYNVCKVVLLDVRFQQSPGGKTHHHQYAGGLLRHTLEVVENCEKMAGPGVDVSVLYTAAIWHDYHKIHEYRIGACGEVEGLPYRKLIGHVSGGFAEFMREAERVGLGVARRDAIAHCLLAHHGRHEWRSPVEPQTIEAHLLHVADQLSAR